MSDKMHLDDYVKLLKRAKRKAEERAREAEEKAENLQEQMEADNFGWSMPRLWEEKDLPVPRLELCWERLTEDGSVRVCTYVLVHKHLLGDIVAKVFGSTRCNGSPIEDFFMHDAHLDMPFRDGAHASHDSNTLNLPLYVTDPDGNVDIVEGLTQERNSRPIRRGGKSV